MGNSISGEPSVQSVDRALAILTFVASQGHTTVTDVAATLGVHKSTASRLMAVLLEHDMLEQISERGPYRLGLGVVRLAGEVSVVPAPRDTARSVLKQLSLDVGETANLAVLDGSDVLYLDQVAGPNSMSLRSWLGQRVPAYASATGKALTAWLTTDERRACQPTTWNKLAENTITNADDLETDLATIRERGYSIAIEELEVGLAAIAAPVRDEAGSVIATVAISGPAFRITPDRYELVGQQVVDAAEELSGKVDFT